MSLIHPSAIVESGAQIGKGTSIGAYSIIGPNVVLGENNIVEAHVVMTGHTTIGSGNHIFPFASIGSAPQDLKFKGEASRLIIGNNNKIREYVTLQPGTSGGGMETLIGSNNLFMVSSHVGHDCKIGDRIVVANGVAIAGHVTVGDGAILGGLSALHQFVSVGRLALIGGGAMVEGDIPPFCYAQGDRASLCGLNKIGLERNGVEKSTVKELIKLYSSIFNSDMNFSAALSAAKAANLNNPLCIEFLDFIIGSERGVAPRRRK